MSVERDGEPIPLASPARPTPTVTAEERSAVLPSLVAVLTSGIAHESQLSGGRPAAGKTGTQPNNTDAWFVGGTPSWAAVVWLGNPANPQDGMVEIPAFGFKGVRGASYPALVWRSIIEDRVAGSANEPIPGGG